MSVFRWLLIVSLCFVILFSVARDMFEQSATIPSVNAEQLEELLEQGAALIDIRTEWEFRSGHIAGAQHIPIEQIFLEPDLIASHIEGGAVLYCHTGVRVDRLVDLLESKGFDTANLLHLEGDMRGWVSRGRAMASIDD